MEITNTETLIREMFRDISEINVINELIPASTSSKGYSEFKLVDNFLKQKA